MILRGLLLLAFVPLLAFLQGCAGYELGAPSQLPFRKLHIETVRNRSLAPQAQALLTENLIEAFLRDGSVEIVPREEADAILQVTISGYEKDASASQQGDTQRAASFDLHLMARASLLRRGTGAEPYFEDRVFRVRENAFTLAPSLGLTEAAYQYMPILTREMAKDIKNSVVSAW